MQAGISSDLHLSRRQAAPTIVRLQMLLLTKVVESATQYSLRVMTCMQLLIRNVSHSHTALGHLLETALQPQRLVDRGRRGYLAHPG